MLKTVLLLVNHHAAYGIFCHWIAVLSVRASLIEIMHQNINDAMRHLAGICLSQ
jgi:hypothetical protein